MARHHRAQRAAARVRSVENRILPSVACTCIYVSRTAAYSPLRELRQLFLSGLLHCYNAATMYEKTKNREMLMRSFVTCNHILHKNGILDAYGHISVRNPENPTTFFMSRNMPPALITSADDVVEYRIEDAEPIAKNAPKGFIERYIHSEMMKRFSGVNVVVHAHSAEVLPFTISGVPLRPGIHMAGFLGDLNVLRCCFLLLIQRLKAPKFLSGISRTCILQVISQTCLCEILRLVRPSPQHIIPQK